MRINLGYEEIGKIKSLSERLRNLGTKNVSYRDSRIKSENLQLNLSLIISKIILKLNFVDKSKVVFTKLLDEYNRENNISINFEDFLDEHWIRIINDEIIIPELVRNLVWSIGYKGIDVCLHQIPENKIIHAQVLSKYYQYCSVNDKPNITIDDLETLLNRISNKAITKEFLIECKILTFDAENQVYLWNGSEYKSHLNKEIASTLWILLGGKNASKQDFKLFINLITKTGIGVDNWKEYLCKDSTDKIYSYAISILSDEKDLQNSDDEFKKSYLDAPQYLNIDIKNKIPEVVFNYNNTYDFINEIDFFDYRIGDILHTQESRSFYYSLLKLIIFNEPKHPTPYQNTLKLLKDTSKPFLVLTLYELIPRQFPEIIPYLLTDSELIPIGYNLLDKIEINETLLVEQKSNDDKFKECCVLKNDLWFEMFDFTLEQLTSSHFQEKESGELLCKILLYVTKRLFNFKPSNVKTNIEHNIIKKRSEKLLSKISHKRTSSSSQKTSKLIYSVLPEIFNYFKRTYSNNRSYKNEFLSFDSGFVVLSIELLKLAELLISELEDSNGETNKILPTSDEITMMLKKYLTHYFCDNFITVQERDSLQTKLQKAKRGFNNFGFEFVDWGYLYLQLEKNNKLKSINEKFNDSLEFIISSNKYNKQNAEQYEKIKLYLKSLLLGYLSINKSKELYKIDNFSVKETLIELEKIIGSSALTYSVNDLPNKKIDVFYNNYIDFGNTLDNQTLTSLLFKSINFFKETTLNEFIAVFFSQCTDVGRMLSAINIIESEELKTCISNKINEIKIEDFIDSCNTINELEYILIESVNSINHWELSKPIIKRIQEHIEKVKINNDQTDNFLFNINLLIAFKEKDLLTITNLSVPQKRYSSFEPNHEGKNLKQFYIALHKLYNENNYDDAIRILKLLKLQDAKNIRFAFYLYCAETTKAVKLKMNKALLKQANQVWDKFTDNLKSDEKEMPLEMLETIYSNKLYYYFVIKDHINFDQIFNRLTKYFLFEEDKLEIVFHFYLERELHELAFNYLKEANDYYDSQEDYPDILEELLDKYPDLETRKKLKLTIGLLPSQRALDIPKILPSNLNGKTNLSLFILNELVQASRIMITKIEAIRQITHENRFNDLILAILKLRLPIWGWSIDDQPRVGGTLVVKDKNGYRG